MTVRVTFTHKVTKEYTFDNAKELEVLQAVSNRAGELFDELVEGAHVIDGEFDDFVLERWVSTQDDWRFIR